MHWCVLLLLASPELFSGRLRQGLTALERGDLGKASAELQAAAELQPKSPFPWVGLAQTRWRGGNREAALEAARKADSLAGTDQIVRQALAQFYADAALQSWDAGERQLAASLVKEALARQERGDLHFLLGLASREEGQLAEAEKQFRAAMLQAPKEEPYRFELAQHLLKNGRFADAVPVLEDGQKLFPQSAQMRLALGVAYYAQRRFPDAVEAFLETIRLAPDVEQPYIFLGQMTDQLGEHLAAFSGLADTWAKGQPRNHRAPLVQAKVRNAMQRDPGEIEPLLRRSIELNAADWESHFELGVLLSKRRALAEAAGELERSATLNPKQPSPYYHLARVYGRLGKPDQAAAAREQHARLTAAQP